MWRRGLAGLIGGLAMAVLLGACASGVAAPTPGSTTQPGPATPAAEELFTGHDTCSGDEAGGIVCERTMTDPRLSGTLTSPGRTGGGDDPQLYAEWWTFTLANDGGSWECKQFMLGATETGTGFIDQVCTGAEGYAGLTAYVHSISSNAASDFGVLAWIEDTTQAAGS